MHRIILLILILGITGCTNKYEKATEQNLEMFFSYQWRDFSEMVADIGPPSYSRPRKKGGTTYYYETYYSGSELVVMDKLLYRNLECSLTVHTIKEGVIVDLHFKGTLSGCAPFTMLMTPRKIPPD